MTGAALPWLAVSDQALQRSTAVGNVTVNAPSLFVCAR
jgi:hypothetical protein